MKLKKDILIKINTDFGEKSNEAIDILNDGIRSLRESRDDDLNSYQINYLIRCILFLSEGNIDNLHHFIDMAHLNAAGIITWADYELVDEEDVEIIKKVRNLDKPYEN